MKKNFLVQLKKILVYASILFTLFLTVVFIILFFSAISPLFAASDSAVVAKSSLYVLKIAFFTVKLAFFSTILALAFGIPTAFFSAKRNFFGNRFLESLSAIPLCIPPLLVALGYVSTFGIQGIANKILVQIFHFESSPITFLYSSFGIVFVQGFYNFPLVMKIVGDAWKHIPPQQEESARMLGVKDFCIFRTITIFQLLPSIMSGAIMVFLFCFFSFIIVLLFGGAGTTTLEVAVYQSARSTLNFTLAAKLALVETIIASVIVTFYTLLEKKSEHEKGFVDFQKNTDIFYSSKSKLIEKILFVVLFMIILVCFVLPFIMIAFNAFFYSGGAHGGKGLSSFTIKNFAKVFLSKAFYDSLIHTIQTATCTSLLCTVAGISYALFLKTKSLKSSERFGKKSSYLQTLYKILPMLPMSVSSVVISFGITLLVRRGTPFLLIIAQTVLFWPFAFRQIVHGSERIPNELIEASMILSKNPVEKYFSIMLPLCKENIISAFGFCFALSAGDASIPLILAIPRYETLALFTYRLAGSYRFGEACACGCILALLTAGIFTISSFSEKKNELS